MIDVPVRVRDALKDGSYKKNFRIAVFDLVDEDEVIATIENENLVSESVSIDERMCSGDDLKFGLCEGANLEFQYFDTDDNQIGNITGLRIKAYIDCEYADEDGEIDEYTISFGYFTVEECSRQASTGIIRASCYNKLKSDYLDQKANEILLAQFDNPNTPIMAVDIKNMLLKDYEIKQEPETYDPFLYSPDDHMYCVFNLPFKFTDLHTSNAFNAYPAEVTSTSITKYVALVSRSYLYYLPNDKRTVRLNEISPMSNCFEVYENNIYEYLVEMLRVAPTNLNQTNVKNALKSGSAKQFIFDGTSTVMKNTGTGISAISYMEVIFKDNRKELYSTFGYEHGDNRINGTYRDMFNKTFEDVDRFLFYIPASLGCTNSYTSPTYAGTSAWCDFGPVYDGFQFYYTWTDGAGNVNTNYATKCFDGKSYFPERWTDYHLNCFFPSWYTDLDKTTVVPAELSDFTLRDITSALFEVQAQYGQLDRNTDLFSGITLNSKRLYPSNTLYPAETLFPDSVSERANKAMYSNLWADEGNVRSFKYLIITYKGLNSEGNEEDKILQRTVNTNGTDNYNMSDNWLFRNLVWTADQVGQYADTMVSLMKDVRWFPFEMWCAGLPYLETGDEIEINTAGGTYISYILSRKLSGIQNLQDTFQNGKLNIF